MRAVLAVVLAVGMVGSAWAGEYVRQPPPRHHETFSELLGLPDIKLHSEPTPQEIAAQIIASQPRPCVIGQIQSSQITSKRDLTLYYALVDAALKAGCTYEAPSV